MLQRRVTLPLRSSNSKRFVSTNFTYKAAPSPKNYGQNSGAPASNEGRSMQVDVSKWARSRPPGTTVNETTKLSNKWERKNPPPSTTSPSRVGNYAPRRFERPSPGVATTEHRSSQGRSSGVSSSDKWGRPEHRTKRTDSVNTSQQNLGRNTGDVALPKTESSTSQLETPSADLVTLTSDNDIKEGRSDLDIEPVEEFDLRPSKRLHKEMKYKSRGSLMEGGVIERHSRVSDVRKPLQRKGSRLKREIKVMPDVYIPNVISVTQLAKALNVKLARLQRKMVHAGMEEATSHDHVLSSEYASMLALEFDRNPVVDNEAAFDILPLPPHPDPALLPLRPPIVTIMGHVDHGKTTLLDTLRSASVAKGEAGGITQHIGAFSVPVSTSGQQKRTITFLDTPGHAAFSAMRARGAMVTDIIVLVVAADDGVMPQTKEVIELIRNEERQGKLNVVVAINKMDKPGADSMAIKKALLAENLILEDFGGEIPAVEVSGLTGQGLNALIETISVVAELADIRAEHTGDIFGYVLESNVHKGLGPVATVLVLRGELKQGANLISGTTHARARQLVDSSGKVVKSAHPGMAVTIAGWKGLPDAGNDVLQGNESDIKKAITNRERRLELAAVVEDADAINIQRKMERERRQDEQAAAVAGVALPSQPVEDVPKQLRLIIKCDVSGTVEAVKGALQGIGNNKASVKIVRATVGDVAESDISLAKASEGMIVAFSVGVSRPMQALAASNYVPILSSNIIYRLMDDIKERVIALLPPIIEQHVTGEASVTQLFDIHLKRNEILKVAGCKVINGVVEKDKIIRVIRNGDIILEDGRLQTLRHHKKDMEAIRKDSECGLSIESFPDLRAGDILRCINIVKKPAKL